MRTSRFVARAVVSFIALTFGISFVALAAASPVVTQINRSTGPTGGGTAGTISGSNFVAGAATVVFGGNAAASGSCSSMTQCTATSPAGSGNVGGIVLRSDR
jgi:hypothetical protein